MMWSDVIPQDVQELGAELAKRAACEREAGRTIYPPQEQIFRALELTTPEKVKVCLVGQDPYHEAGQANGLCFSVTVVCFFHRRSKTSSRNWSVTLVVRIRKVET